MDAHEQHTPTGDELTSLLAGDVGVVCVRALAEAGVSWIASSWSDAPTPIDAAINAARDTLLAPHGVLLRRATSATALVELVSSSPAERARQSSGQRGAIVLGGRRGLRPTLERLRSQATSGPVVCITFDDDATRMQDAIVVDPEPTPMAFRSAIAQALTASALAQRVAFVVVRERLLGMRGTMVAGNIPTRAERDSLDGDAIDAAEPLDVAHAIERSGLVRIVEPATGHATATKHVIVADGPMGTTIERAIAVVDAALHEHGCAPAGAHITSITRRVAGSTVARDGVVATHMCAADNVLVIGAHAARTARDITALTAPKRPRDVALDVAQLRVEYVAACIATWLLDIDERERAARAAEEPDSAYRRALSAVAACGAVDHTSARVRVPRRGDVINRSVPAPIAAALVLAQGVIGVPGRERSDVPTYTTAAGVPLTVVDGPTFAAHAGDCVGPVASPAVVLVSSSAPGILEAAGRMGATVEFVDADSPRDVGAAIARSCAAPRTTPHVIAVTTVTRVAAPARRVFGVDAELVGTDRIACAAVPATGLRMVDTGDDMLAGPVLVPVDTPATRAALASVQSLTAATWELRAAAPTANRVQRTAWSMRRRSIRSSTGVDL